MMADPVTITVAGDPQGKGRARAFRRGNFIGHYTPEKTRTYEGIIRSLAMDAMTGRVPIETPVEIELSIIFGVPASWSRKKRALALAGEVKPAKKPDADNVIKAFTDAMNGVVYRDDVQIVRGRFHKSYGPAALVCATIREVA
jgi:Holliday junction resolvase RusA-like endonuclease